MSLELTERGLEFRRTVGAPAGRRELVAGLVVWLAVVGGTALWGVSAFRMGVAAVVGAVLGHLPGLIPRSGEVRFVVDDRAIHWELFDGPDRVDAHEVAIADVVDALVMPHEGQGWGLEVHFRDERERVRVWTPQLPLPSDADAQRVVRWIREKAGIEGPRLPPRAELL